MFFKKTDRQLLRQISIDQQATAEAIAGWLVVVNQILIDISKNMPTRKELNAALDSENKAIVAAAERIEQQLKDKTAALQDQLNNLQAKHDAGEDFTAELAAVNQHVADLNQLATTPLAQLANPAGTATGTSTGAAGTTVGGPALNTAAEAAGGKISEDNPKAGSTPMPHEPNTPQNANANASAPTAPSLEWGTGDHDGMVRDLPDGDWRTPTAEETASK